MMFKTILSGESSKYKGSLVSKSVEAVSAFEFTMIIYFSCFLQIKRQGLNFFSILTNPSLLIPTLKNVKLPSKYIIIKYIQPNSCLTQKTLEQPSYKGKKKAQNPKTCLASKSSTKDERH